MAEVVFDLLIGFFLFFPRFRKIGIIGAIAFNILNAWIFNDINIFPYFMIVALILFAEPSKVGSFFSVEEKKKSKKEKTESLQLENSPLKKSVLVLLSIYFLLQISLPLRHFFYQGNTDWDGYAHLFSWRMKIQARANEKIEFKVKDVDKKIIYPIDFRSYHLNQDQIRRLALDPYDAVQFAHFLKQHCIQNKGMKNVEIVSDIIVSFNGRKPQKIFDTQLDLTKLNTPEEVKSHVLALKK